MATVTVPAEFFRGELRVYGDWRQALARELLQNATDANPTRIDVKFDNVDGHGRITFTDDGHGMSRDVLEQVFFALGKTTKTGPDSIGGFGRARIIICFAQTRYQIRTGHLVAEGEGGQYTIREVPEYQPGCQFVIDLLDDDSRSVELAFKDLLRTCNLNVPITLNGSPAQGRNMPKRATRVMRDDNGNVWARTYVDSGWGRILVRVHGLTMFSRWISGNDDVVVELKPSRSREVLSASRDTLHTRFGEQLDQFVSDLTRNRRQALKPVAAPLDLRVGGGGFLATDASEDTDTDSTPSAGATTSTAPGSDQSGSSPDGGLRVRVTPANEAAYVNSLNAAAQRLGELDLGLLEPQPAAPVGFDVFLMADANDTRVRKLARAWDPSGWDERTGRRRRALLLTWKAAVAYAMDVLVTQRPALGRVLWTVGWTFDTDVEAVHRGIGDGHVLALNPVTDTGTVRFSPSQRASRQKLLAIALHEVCHVVVDGHDEQFAGLLTDLVGALDPAAADRAMRDAAATA